MGVSEDALHRVGLAGKALQQLFLEVEHGVAHFEQPGGSDIGWVVLVRCDATTRIDVSPFIGAKMAALAAYRSQYAFDPDLVPVGLLTELFGVEYFVRAKPSGLLESDIT